MNQLTITNTTHIVRIIHYKITWLILSILTFHYVPASTLAEFSFQNPEQMQTFRNLTEQLRCLVCQNESIAASQAELAQDLRREIYTMLQAGKTQNQIIEFLVHRYGDFILYNPPLKPSTYFLWYGPLLFSIIAGTLLIRVLIQHKQIPETKISPQEQARIAAIIKQDKPL